MLILSLEYSCLFALFLASLLTSSYHLSTENEREHVLEPRAARPLCSVWLSALLPTSLCISVRLSAYLNLPRINEHVLLCFGMTHHSYTTVTLLRHVSSGTGTPVEHHGDATSHKYCTSLIPLRHHLFRMDDQVSFHALPDMADEEGGHGGRHENGHGGHGGL